MIYKGILQSRSLYKRILILTACVVLLYLEFVRGQYLYIVLTLLLILAVFHRKEHIVSEEGVDIKYSLFGMTTTNRWTWDQITAVQPDYIKERPNARVLFEGCGPPLVSVYARRLSGRAEAGSKDES